MKTATKKFVAILSVVMFAILAIVPMGCASADSSVMYVTSSNGGSVRLRELPDGESKVVTNFNVGRPVEVVGYSGEWTEVCVKVSGKYVHGYMMNKFLTSRNPANASQRFSTVKKSFTVKPRPASSNGVVSMWSTTSKKDCNKILDLGRNTRVTVLAESKAWYKVTTENGVVGYVAKAYVTK